MLILMRRLASVRAPREACGVIFGDGHRRQFERLAELTNVASSDRTFSFDPEEQLQLWHEEARRGRIPLALWHSHPRSPPVPSATDELCMSMHPSLVHLILHDRQIRAYRWKGRRVISQDLVLLPGSIRVD
ncbi:M67 family metallopeptidase [Pseudonocardia alni]